MTGIILSFRQIDGKWFSIVAVNAYRKYQEWRIPHEEWHFQGREISFSSEGATLEYSVDITLY